MDVKQRVVVGFIVVVLFGGVIAWIYKISTYKPPLPEVYISSLPDTEVAFKTSDKEVFAEEEENRQVQLEAQRTEEMLAKRKAKKEMSTECQFWKLQKKSRKSAVADKKIEQYCTITDEASSIKP